jgi:hypothetical protein
MRIYHIGQESFSQRKPSWLQQFFSLTFVPGKLRPRSGLVAYARSMLSGKSQLDRLGLPTISESALWDMGRGKRPFPHNDDSWGLGGEDLDETVPLRAGWDSPAGRELVN